MGRSKSLERDSFREVPFPDDERDADLRIGLVLVAADAEWRVVGIVPHPHRPGDRLVFVERLEPCS